jgi:hypothetical protein
MAFFKEIQSPSGNTFFVNMDAVHYIEATADNRAVIHFGHEGGGLVVGVPARAIAEASNAR